VNDLKEHENTPECWCRPQLDPYSEGFLYVHNALDRRDQELH
jgi:hypothetical protein